MIPRFEPYDIARYEIGRLDERDNAAAHHIGPGGCHFLERIECGFGTGFLHGAHHNVQQYHSQNNNRIRQFFRLNQSADHRSGQQHKYHQIFKLTDNDTRQRFLVSFF